MGDIEEKARFRDPARIAEHVVKPRKTCVSPWAVEVMSIQVDRASPAPEVGTARSGSSQRSGLFLDLPYSTSLF